MGENPISQRTFSTKFNPSHLEKTRIKTSNNNKASNWAAKYGVATFYISGTPQMLHVFTLLLSD